MERRRARDACDTRADDDSLCGRPTWVSRERPPRLETRPPTTPTPPAMAALVRRISKKPTETERFFVSSSRDRSRPSGRSNARRGSCRSPRHFASARRVYPNPRCPSTRAHRSRRRGYCAIPPRRPALGPTPRFVSFVCPRLGAAPGLFTGSGRPACLRTSRCSPWSTPAATRVSGTFSSTKACRTSRARSWTP